MAPVELVEQIEEIIVETASKFGLPFRVVKELLALESMYSDSRLAKDEHDLKARIETIVSDFSECGPSNGYAS